MYFVKIAMINPTFKQRKNTSQLIQSHTIIKNC